MKKVIASIVAVLALSSNAFAGDTTKYSLEVKAPASAKKGEKVTVPVTIKGKGEFHFNQDYPFSVKLTAPAGVKLDKDTLKKEDTKTFDKTKGAAFDIAFTSADTGKKSISGEVKFAVCTDKDCAPQTEKIAFETEVK